MKQTVILKKEFDKKYLESMTRKLKGLDEDDLWEIENKINDNYLLSCEIDNILEDLVDKVLSKKIEKEV